MDEPSDDRLDDHHQDRPAPAPSLDEIEARLQGALDRAKGSLHPDSEGSDPLDAEAARLERLEAAIDTGTGTRMPTPEETALDGPMREVEAKVRDVQERRSRMDAEIDRQRRGDQESARGLGTGLMAAYALIGLPMVGAGAGYLLNRVTGGNAWLPIFAILGMVAGIWWVLRLTGAQDRRP